MLNKSITKIHRVVVICQIQSWTEKQPQFSSSLFQDASTVLVGSWTPNKPPTNTTQHPRRARMSAIQQQKHKISQTPTVLEHNPYPTNMATCSISNILKTNKRQNDH